MHIRVDFCFFIMVQSFANIAQRLMVAETSNVKISPPEVFVEFGIIRIQKLEVMGQSFGTEKVENEMSVVLQQQLGPATTCQKMGCNTK